jgi:hypothetical protein
MCAPVFAQDQSEHGTSAASQHSANSQRERCGLKKLDQCLKDWAHDQAGIWTSPLHVNSHDAIWLVPFASATGAAGAAVAYDQDALRQVGTTNKSLVNKSEVVSDFGSAYASAYGFATAISADCITARQHFPSDVVVGSTFGYLIGGYVVRRHSSAYQDQSSATSYI